LERAPPHPALPHQGRHGTVTGWTTGQPEAEHLLTQAEVLAADTAGLLDRTGAALGSARPTWGGHHRCGRGVWPTAR
jgi:hypothetical protein